MTCPRCASPVEDGARFCASCGASLADAGTDVVSGESNSAPDPDDTLFGDDDVDATPDIGDLVPTGATRSVPTQPPAAAPATAVTAEEVVVPAGTVSCPACGATNSSARMLCGRCGADLVTGEAPVADRAVVHPGPAVDVAGEVDVRERGDGPRTALVVAVIVVLGALVGVGIGVWAVDAGRPVAEPPPAFDAAVYPGEPEDLVVGGVGASSTLGEGSGAPLMVDADLTTAWRHDPGEQPADEVDLAFAFDEPVWVTSVVFANGDQADAATFAAAARVRSMLLVVDGDPVAELQLQDIEGYQRVDLPTPVLTSTLRFQFVDVHAGGGADEVALSEVAFVGYVAVGVDRERAAG